MRLVMPVACLSIAVAVWDIWGWIVGLISCTVILVAAHEEHVNRRNREWRERWEAREQTWRSRDV